MLGNKNLIKSLREEKFDVVVIDLLYNECGLALLNHLGLPAIGFWAQSFTGQVILRRNKLFKLKNVSKMKEADLTEAALLPSVVPFYTTQNTWNMNIAERTANVLMKAFMWSLTVAQCCYLDLVIWQHLPNTPR